MYEHNGATKIESLIGSSRIDMLLAIYDAAIEATSTVEEMLRTGKAHEAALAKSQALVLVALIESGLDLDRGQVPNKIKDLCGFVEKSLLDSNRHEIASSVKILTNIRDGFAGIKQEAIELEQIGEIPKVTTVSVDTMA